MTKRTSKAAGIVPAAGAAVAIAAAVAADASVGTEDERPNDDAGVAGLVVTDQVIGTEPKEGIAASDGPIDIMATATGGDLPPVPADIQLSIDTSDPNVALAIIAVERIRNAAALEEQFAAVLDAADLIRPMADKFDFLEIAPAEEPELPAWQKLDPADLVGRVLEVRAIVSGGRRRAGIAFGSEPQPVNVDDLSEEQLAAILSDDHLAVQVTD